MKNNTIINVIKKILYFDIKAYYMFIVLALINFLLFYNYYGNYSVFSDSSREVYIPMVMNKGFSLYKDIFNVYAPLGYQMNASLFSVFGEKLDTLYIMGFINSTFILWGLYIILKLFLKKSSVVIFSILFLIINSICIEFLYLGINLSFILYKN